MFNKINNKLSLFVTAFVFGLLSVVGTASAAPDPDLVNTIASTTAIANDNKATMISYYVALGMIALAIGLSKGAVLVSIRWIKRALFGGRRK